MRIFLKVIGYLLIVLFGTELFYLFAGVPLANQSLGNTLWHFFYTAGMFTLGIWMTTGKPEINKSPDSKSKFLGILSLLFGVTGIFWWPVVLGILAVSSAILQFRKSTSRTAIAGLCLGVIDFILAAVWSDLGLIPSIF